MNGNKQTQGVLSKESNLVLTSKQKETADKITGAYASFGVKIGGLVGVSAGSRVTRFDFQIEPDTKISNITRYRDDISLLLAVPKIRIVCPLPGKLAFGLEVPNGNDGVVAFDDVFHSDAFSQSTDKLCVVLGKDIANENVCLELSRAPHVLIGGQAYSGKTTLLNNMIVSLIGNTRPADVQLLLIAPRKDELTVFEESDHLLKPIICDEQAAVDNLKSLCEECDRRFELFRNYSVRSIDAYNHVAQQPLCRMVVFVDEMSFLTERRLSDFEYAVCQLAQKGRIAGIHLVLATGALNSRNVTGFMKANIPTRIALSTKDSMESRTIIDAVDAECLLLKGDLLLCDCMMNKPQRIQAAYLSPQEIREKMKNAKERRYE